MTFSHPFVLLFAIPLFAWLVFAWVFVRRNSKASKRAVPVSDIGNFPKSVERRALVSGVARFAMFAAIALGIVVLAAGPRAEGHSQTLILEKEVNVSNVMIVFDCSDSMQRQRTFTNGKDALIYFLQQQKQTMQGKVRIGVICYGAGSFLYRVPGYDLDALIKNLQEWKFSSKFSYPFGEWNNMYIRPMVDGTMTPNALFHAGRVLKDLEGKDANIRSSAILLVSDLHEAKPPIYEAIDIVTSAGINLHIVSVTRDASGKVASGFNQHIESNPRAYYYDVLNFVSEEEVREVGQRIAELETIKAPVTFSRISGEKDLAPLVAIWLYFAAFTFILLTETVLRRARTPSQERRDKDA